MKNILIIVLIFSVLVNFSMAREIKTSPDNVLRFELVSYSPSPVQPGDEFDAAIKVKNIERKTIKNIRIDISEAFPFTFREGSQTQIFDQLKQNQEKTFVVTLVTSENANFGTEKLHFSYTYDGLEQIRTETFSINIESVGNIVSLDSIETDPVRIFPGEPAKLTVSVENSGNSLLNDVVVKLNLTDPFSILYTTNERRISSLASGESIKLVYDLITTSDAESKPYSFPLQIEYFDEIGTKFARSNTIGLLVYAPPKYDINLEDSDVLAYGSKGSITLSFSNINPSNMRFLSTMLNDGEDYITVSNPKKYLGNLEPDDFETAEYEIYIKNCFFSCKDEIELSLQLDYKDDFNKEFQVVEKVPIKVYKKGELKKLGLSTGDGKGVFVIIIVIVILTYLTFRYYRKEKDLPNAIRQAFATLIIGIFRVISLIRWRRLKRLPRKIRILWIRANDKGLS